MSPELCRYNDLTMMLCAMLLYYVCSYYQAKRLYWRDLSHYQSSTAVNDLQIKIYHQIHPHSDACPNLMQKPGRLDSARDSAGADAAFYIGLL